MRDYSDIQITDETLPWKQPHEGRNIYTLGNDGPDHVVTFIAAGAQMRVTPTRETGFDSGRRRYEVRCLTCNEIIHPATTSSTERVGHHLFETHNWDGAPATLIAEPVVTEVVDDASPLPRTIILSDLIFDPIDAAAPTTRNVSIAGIADIMAGTLRTMIEVPAVSPSIESASIWVTTKTRPSWGEHHMMEAYIAALRGSCLRKRVGAVIIDPNNRLVSGGFNGAPSKQDDCLTVGCDIQIVNGRPGCRRTLHAESNALDYAGRQARGCALFTTVIPCRPCAMRIIQAGIDSVFYSEYYESQGTKETQELLISANVKILQITLPINELTVALRRAVGEIP